MGGINNKAAHAHLRLWRQDKKSYTKWLDMMCTELTQKLAGKRLIIVKGGVLEFMDKY